MNAADPSYRSLEESIRDSHNNMSSIESVAWAIIEDLVGPSTSAMVDEPPINGMVDNADRLASRTAALIATLQNIRSRIAEPKVVPLGQGQQLRTSSERI